MFKASSLKPRRLWLELEQGNLLNVSNVSGLGAWGTKSGSLLFNGTHWVFKCLTNSGVLPSNWIVYLELLQPSLDSQVYRCIPIIEWFRYASQNDNIRMKVMVEYLPLLVKFFLFSKAADYTKTQPKHAPWLTCNQASTSACQKDTTSTSFGWCSPFGQHVVTTTRGHVRLDWLNHIDRVSQFCTNVFNRRYGYNRSGYGPTESTVRFRYLYYTVLDSQCSEVNSNHLHRSDDTRLWFW